MPARTFLFSHFQLVQLYFQDAQRNVQPSFIVDDSDDEDMVDHAVEEESDDDVFDSVCAFCDNGGNIIWYAFSVILCCPINILGRYFEIFVNQHWASGYWDLG